MFTLIIDRRDVSLDYEAQCLIVRHPELPTRSIPMKQLRKIVCLHGVTLHTRVVGQCQHHGIDFIQLNQRASDRSFAVHAAHQRQAHRRLSQYHLATFPAGAFSVAKRLVRMKLLHAMRVLDPCDDAALRGYLRQQVSSIDACTDPASLRGLEGSAQRALFQHWRTRLPQGVGFQRRERRPPPDPVNALLSLTYTLAHHEAIRQCLVNGLDPWLGFYHRPAHGRQSLACDLIEVLRPRIERWVVQQFNDKQVEARDFSRVNGACLLGKAGRERYYEQWYAMQKTWSASLRHHAAVLARHLDTLAVPELEGMAA